MSSGGPGSGLFKSTDGGETWTEITRNPGLPAGVVGRIGVAVSGADSNRVYALVENENGGLFAQRRRRRDVDARRTATATSGSARSTTRTSPPIRSAKDTVYMLNVSAYRSTDGGKTLTAVGGGTHGDHHDLWIDPDDPKHLVLGNDGGGAVSSMAAAGRPQRSWTAQDFPTPQYYHVVTTQHVPYHVCGAQQDGSTVCVPSDTGRRPAAWRRRRRRRRRRAAPALYSPGGAEPGYVAPDPKDPDIFFAGGNNGSFLDAPEPPHRREPRSQSVSAHVLGRAVERARRALAVDVSRSSSRPPIRTCSTPRRSTCGRRPTAARRWDKISGDLTRHDPKTMGDSGGPITNDMNAPEVYGTVFALGPGKKDVNIIWAGSDDGLVHVTRDGGKTWTNVTPKDMPDFGRVSQIDASAFDPGAAYVAVKKPLLDDLAPVHLPHARLRQDVDEDRHRHPAERLRARRPRGSDAARAALRRHAARRLRLVRRRRPLGAAALNLPDTPVSDLLVEDNSIAIATHGRGFYILDDIAPLRQSGADGDDRRRCVSVQARRRDPSAPAARRSRYLLKKPAREADDRDPRREGTDRADVHGRARRRPRRARSRRGASRGRRRRRTGGGAGDSDGGATGGRQAPGRPAAATEEPDAQAGGGRGRGGAADGVTWPPA